MSHMESRPADPTFCAIVLADGYSSRMNLWKPEIRIDDIPLIVHALKPAVSICQQILIIGGYQFVKLVQLIRECDKLAKGDFQKMSFVENKNYATGMFSSVKAGMAKVGQSIEGVFIVPGDMPFIQIETYKRLAESFRRHPEIDVFTPVTTVDPQGATEPARTKKGHPILLRQRMQASILRENDEAVLRDVVKNNSAEICAVEDKGICIDIDVESDLALHSSYFKQGRV